MTEGRSAAASMRPIFIGGHHRSGTTLMRVMLDRHPHIASGPEGKLLDRTSFLEFHQHLQAVWPPEELQRFGFGSEVVDGAIAAFIADFFTRYRIRQGKPRWAEKTPGNIRHIDYLFRLFPQAQFVHMVRDPRDVYCSILEKKRNDPKFAGWTVEKMTTTWVECVERGLRWRHDRGRYLEVRYEDLVSEPGRTMRHVLAFLGESWHECVLDSTSDPQWPLATSNTHRPVFSTSVSRWRRELTAEDLDHIETVTGPLMRDLGYRRVRATAAPGLTDGSVAET